MSARPWRRSRSSGRASARSRWSCSGSGRATASSAGSSTERGIPFRAIQAGKLRRYLSLENLIDLGRLPVGTAQALGRCAASAPSRLRHRRLRQCPDRRGGGATTPAGPDPRADRPVRARRTGSSCASPPRSPSPTRRRAPTCPRRSGASSSPAIRCAPISSRGDRREGARLLGLDPDRADTLRHRRGAGGAGGQRDDRGDPARAAGALPGRPLARHPGGLADAGRLRGDRR